MKVKRSFSSLVVAAVLLFAVVLGALILGTQAEAINEVYTVDGTGEGEKTYATVSEALAAAKNATWPSDSTLKIALTASTTETVTDGKIFSVNTIFKTDGKRLPITVEGEGDVTLSFPTSSTTLQATNEYIFKTLKMNLREVAFGVYAGSGEVTFDTVTFTGEKSPKFYGDALDANPFAGWEKANFDAEKGSDNLLPVGIAFVNTTYNSPNAADWNYSYLHGSCGSMTTKHTSGDFTLNRSMLHAHLTAGEGSNLTRLAGCSFGDSPAYPGKITLHINGGTVKGVAADSGSSVEYSSGNGGNTVQKTAKAPKIDIIVDSGVVNPLDSNKYAISGLVNGKYSNDAQINITVNGGEVKGMICGVGGASVSTGKKAGSNAAYWYDGAMETAGNILVNINGGTITGPVYGVLSQNDYNCHTFSGNLTINLNCTNALAAYGAYSIKGGTVSCDDPALVPARGEGTVIANGGKVTVSVNAGTFTGSAYAIGGDGGVIQSGGEAGLAVTGGTVNASYFRLTEKNTAKIQAGATASAKFLGGVVKNDRYFTAGARANESALQTGGTVYILIDGADFSSLSYLYPVKDSTIHGNVHVEVRNATFKATGFSFRWISECEIYGDATLTVDTTVDGWGGSSANKSGAAVKLDTMQSWSTSVYGNSYTRIDGGEDYSSISFTNLYGASANNVNNTVKNCTIANFYGNRGGTVSTATEAANGIQNINNEFVGVHVTTLYTGGGNPYNAQTIHGTVTNTIEDCHFYDASATKAQTIFYGGSQSKADTHNNITNIFKGTNYMAEIVLGSSTGTVKGNVTATFESKFERYYPGTSTLIKGGATVTTHGSAPVGGNVELNFLTGFSSPTTTYNIYDGAGKVTGTKTLVSNGGTFSWHVKFPANFTMDFDNTNINGYAYMRSNSTATVDGCSFKYGIRNENDNVVGTKLTITDSTINEYNDYYVSGKFSFEATVNVNTLIINSGTFYSRIYGGNVTINGGTFKVKESSSYQAFSHVKAHNRLTLAGGTFEKSKIEYGALTFAGGTVTVNGLSHENYENRFIADSATAKTTIIRNSTDRAPCTMLYGVEYVRAPKDMAEYQIVGSTYRIPIITNDENGYVVKGFMLYPTVQLTIADRVKVSLLFDKLAVDAMKEAGSPFRYDFGTDASASSLAFAISEENATVWADGIEFYVVSHEALGAADFDKTYYYYNGTERIETSIQAISEKGAELYDGVNRKVFKALSNLGVSVENQISGTNVAVPFPEFTIKENSYRNEDYSVSRESGAAIDFRKISLLSGDAIGLRLKGICNASDPAISVQVNGQTLPSSVYLVNREGENISIDLYMNALYLNDILTIKVNVDGVNAITLVDSIEHIASQMATKTEDGKWFYIFILAVGEKNVNTVATAADQETLEGKYKDRTPYYGDAHDHAKTGPRSDGHNTLTEWLAALTEVDQDFQAILDHRQVKHMYLPEWDSTIFICGSEAASSIKDSKATGSKAIHFNMIVDDRQDLVDLLLAFPKFNFNGGTEGVILENGVFDYPGYTIAEMQQIISFLKERGGMWTNAHPKQQMGSENPLDYWFADYTGLEVFYMDMANDYTVENYKLWLDLLALGKRVWATTGCDVHRLPVARTLTTVYADQKLASNFVKYMAQGDTTCGPVGVRMTLGDANTGGHTDFDGKRLVLSVGDFHSSVFNPDHQYRVDVITDDGLVYSQYVSCEEMTYIALDADEDAAFYRVEVHDENLASSLIALGNPIWND